MAFRELIRSARRALEWLWAARPRAAAPDSRQQFTVSTFSLREPQWPQPDLEQDTCQRLVGSLASYLQVDPVRLELSRDLVDLVPSLLESLADLRKRLLLETGWSIPGIRVAESAQRPPSTFTVEILGVEAFSGHCPPGSLLAVGDLRRLTFCSPASPVGNLPSAWIARNCRLAAEAARCLVYEPHEAIALRLEQVLRASSPDLLNRQRVLDLLEASHLRAPSLVDFTGRYKRVLQALLRAGVSIADQPVILAATTAAWLGRATEATDPQDAVNAAVQAAHEALRSGEVACPFGLETVAALALSRLDWDQTAILLRHLSLDEVRSLATGWSRLGRLGDADAWWNAFPDLDVSVIWEGEAHLVDAFHRLLGPAPALHRLQQVALLVLSLPEHLGVPVARRLGHVLAGTPVSAAPELFFTRTWPRRRRQAEASTHLLVGPHGPELLESTAGSFRSALAVLRQPCTTPLHDAYLEREIARSLPASPPDLAALLFRAFIAEGEAWRSFVHQASRAPQFLGEALGLWVQRPDVTWTAVSGREQLATVLSVLEPRMAHQAREGLQHWGVNVPRLIASGVRRRRVLRDCLRSLQATALLAGDPAMFRSGFNLQ